MARRVQLLPNMQTKPLHTFTNEDEGVESYVYENGKGGFNVTVKDLDSGNFLPWASVNIPDLASAVHSARHLAALKYTGATL